MNGRPRRWLVVLLGLVLLAAGIVWLRLRIEWVDVEEAIDAKPEARRDPFYGAKAIVRGVGARVVTAENLATLPAPKATLVLVSRHWDLFPGREAGLRRWVEGGGHLVLAETTWLRQEALPGWMRVVLVREKARADDTPSNVRRRPAPSRLAVEACRHLLAEPPDVAPAFDAPRRFRVCGFSAGSLARQDGAAWRLDDGDATRMQRVRVGAGHVSANTVSGAFAGPAIVRGDDALAWAALLALKPGDEVWFVTDEARAPLLATLWQGGSPAIVLAGLVLGVALWRRGARFGPLMTDAKPARRSIGEQVRRTAAFIAARGSGDALLQAARAALDAAARRRVPGYATLADDAARVAAIAAAARVDPARLAAAMAPARGGTGRALAEIEQVRRALVARPRAV
jgi:hypothetical protein